LTVGNLNKPKPWRRWKRPGPPASGSRLGAPRPPAWRSSTATRSATASAPRASPKRRPPPRDLPS